MPDQTRLLKTIRLLLLLVLSAALPGCASWFSEDFIDPEVHLLKVDVVKAKLLEQQFILRFRIDNPNDDSFPVRGLSYSVQLNDVALASGESSEWFNVPARGHQVFEVPVRTNLWRHLKDVVEALEDPDKPIRYSLQGEVKTGLLF
ncbi:MAG TPA: LEA type 2 family protein, partial [Pseudomonas sp.]|nr:LEA type 2 family protein [Pseudomonas sp.]